VQNGFTHELEQNQDVVLLFKVAHQGIDQVILQKRALGDERVDLLLLNFETNSVDQHRDLDGVELVDHGVHFGVFVVKYILVDIN
jgi:hypothetical protein